MEVPGLVCLVMLLVNPSVRAYNEGNFLYESGDYEGAIEKYLEALSSACDARILYNLGNAYFKTGCLGRAVACYRRALFLMPRDGDARSNLEFVRRYRPDRFSPPSNPLVVGMSKAFHFLSHREASLVSAIAFLVTSLFVSAFLLRPRRLWLYAALVPGLLFLYGGCTWLVWEGELRSGAAVIVVPKATARSGPGEEYRETLELHDGLEVRIKQARRGYFLIQAPGGLAGWLKQEEVEPIYPVCALRQRSTSPLLKLSSQGAHSRPGPLPR